MKVNSYYLRTLDANYMINYGFDEGQQVVNEGTKESPNFKAVYRYDFSNLVKNPSADSEVIKSEERHMDCALLAQLYQWKLSKLQKLKPYLSNIKKLRPKLAKLPKSLRPLRNSTNLLRESLIIVDFADLFRHNITSANEYDNNYKNLKFDDLKAETGSNANNNALGYRLRWMFDSENGIQLSFDNKKNWKTFVPFDKSSSMAKECRITFIEKKLKEKIEKQLLLDVFYPDNIRELIPSKYFAYRGLYLSSGKRIEQPKHDSTTKPDDAVAFELNKETVIVIKDRSQLISKLDYDSKNEKHCTDKIFTAQKDADDDDENEWIVSHADNEKVYIFKNNDDEHPTDLILNIYKEETSDEATTLKRIGTVKVIGEENNYLVCDICEGKKKINKSLENNETLYAKLVSKWKCYIKDINDFAQDMNDAEKEDTITLFDGEGLICPAYAEYINTKLREQAKDKSNFRDAHSFQIRLPFTKGMLHEVDFHKFFKEEWPTNKIPKTSALWIEDVFGIPRDLRKAKIILTESMFKCKKWFRTLNDENKLKTYLNPELSQIKSESVYDYMEFYFAKVREYNHALYISLMDSQLTSQAWVMPEEDSVQDSQNLQSEPKTTVPLNYQFLSTLALEREDLDELIANQKKCIDAIPQSITQNVKIDFQDKFEDGADSSLKDALETGWFAEREKCLKAWKMNPAFLTHPRFSSKTRKVIEEEKKSFTRNLLVGRLEAEGEQRFLSGDLLGLLTYICESITNLSLSEEDKTRMWKKCLHPHRFYMPENKIAVRSNKDYGILRNPHLSRNEQCVLRPYMKSLHKKYFSHLTGVIMVSCLSSVPMALGGADFDGDLVKIISDNTVVSAICKGAYGALDETSKTYPYIRKLPVIQIPSVSTNIEFEKNDRDTQLFKNIMNTFKNNIGQISNIAVNLTEIEAKGKILPLDESPAACTIITGLEIDAAKTGEHPTANIDKLKACGTGNNYIDVKSAAKKVPGNYSLNILSTKLTEETKSELTDIKGHTNKIKSLTKEKHPDNVSRKELEDFCLFLSYKIREQIDEDIEQINKSLKEPQIKGMKNCLPYIKLWDLESQLNELVMVPVIDIATLQGLPKVLHDLTNDYKSQDTDLSEDEKLMLISIKINTNKIESMIKENEKSQDPVPVEEMKEFCIAYLGKKVTDIREHMEPIQCSLKERKMYSELMRNLKSSLRKMTDLLPYVPIIDRASLNCLTKDLDTLIKDFKPLPILFHYGSFEVPLSNLEYLVVQAFSYIQDIIAQKQKKQVVGKQSDILQPKCFKFEDDARWNNLDENSMERLEELMDAYSEVKSLSQRIRNLDNISNENKAYYLARNKTLLKIQYDGPNQKLSCGVPLYEALTQANLFIVDTLTLIAETNIATSDVKENNNVTVKSRVIDMIKRSIKYMTKNEWQYAGWNKDLNVKYDFRAEKAAEILLSGTEDFNELKDKEAKEDLLNDITFPVVKELLTNFDNNGYMIFYYLLRDIQENITTKNMDINTYFILKLKKENDSNKKKADKYKKLSGNDAFKVLRGIYSKYRAAKKTGWKQEAIEYVRESMFPTNSPKYDKEPLFPDEDAALQYVCANPNQKKIEFLWEIFTEKEILGKVTVDPTAEHTNIDNRLKYKIEEVKAVKDHA